MALATLTKDRTYAYQDGTAYLVETNPWGVALYDQDARLPWQRFVVENDRCAEFEWQTGADRVHVLAKKIVAGTSTFDEAYKDPQFKKYIDWHLEDLQDADEDTDQDADDDAVEKSTEALYADLIREVAADPTHLFEHDGSCAFYHFESDCHIHDAAKLLVLPPWAEYKRVMSGGPGSGFDAAYICLKTPHTLLDLKVWLDKLLFMIAPLIHIAIVYEFNGTLVRGNTQAHALGSEVDTSGLAAVANARDSDAILFGEGI